MSADSVPDPPRATRCTLASAAGFSMGTLQLRPFSGVRMTIVRVDGPAGSVAPQHSHDHEQITFVEQGRVRFDFPDDSIEAGPGDAVLIPSGLPHGAEVLEAAVFIDIFQPVRDDFMSRVR